MKQCEDVRILIARNDLNEEEKRYVEEHLSSCVECRNVKKALSLIQGDLQVLREAHPPEALQRAFLRRVELEKRRRIRVNPLIFWQSPLGVIAASIFLLVILLVLYTRVFQPFGSETPAILIQLFPSGRVAETVHPPADYLQINRGVTLTVHLILDGEGRVEKVLNLEGGNEELRNRYRELLDRWVFAVPNPGDYMLIITIPEPIDK